MKDEALVSIYNVWFYLSFPSTSLLGHLTYNKRNFLSFWHWHAAFVKVHISLGIWFAKNREKLNNYYEYPFVMWYCWHSNTLNISQDNFPCTAEQFFNLLLSDDSNYINEYRSARKDSEVIVSTFPIDDVVAISVASNNLFFLSNIFHGVEFSFHKIM